MTHYYWTLTLMPGEGWIVRRMRKRGNLWPVVEMEYDRLMHGEAMDVLDYDSSYVLLELALVELTA